MGLGAGIATASEREEREGARLGRQADSGDAMDEGSASMIGSPVDKYETVTDADLPEFMVWRRGTRLTREWTHTLEKRQDKDIVHSRRIALYARA